MERMKTYLLPALDEGLGQLLLVTRSPSRASWGFQLASEIQASLPIII
jgi:hypothetical protein